MRALVQQWIDGGGLNGLRRSIHHQPTWLWAPIPRAVSKIYAICKAAGFVRSYSYNIRNVAVAPFDDDTLAELARRDVYYVNGYEPPNMEQRSGWVAPGD